MPTRNCLVLFSTLVLLACLLTSMKTPAVPPTATRSNLAWTDSSLQLDQLRLPDPVSDPILRSDTPSCVIPFTRAGNLIVIKAHIDSMEGNFILDTGAPHLILNITYFRDYPVTHHQDEMQTGSTGTGAATNRTLINRFILGSFRYSRAEADLINLGHLENSKGIKILGLIGVNMFKQCEVIIDYENSLLYLHHIQRKQASSYKSEQLKDETTYSTIPFDLRDNKIITYSEMAGKKLRFVIDCGAETNLLDSRLPDRVFEYVELSGRTTLLGTGNQRVEAVTGVLKGLRIANRDIATLPIIITNMEKTCFSLNGCADGVLGFDFLSLQKIGFNFVQRKMYIWK
mgnify:CR=1 FL=1